MKNQTSNMKIYHLCDAACCCCFLSQKWLWWVTVCAFWVRIVVSVMVYMKRFGGLHVGKADYMKSFEKAD